MAEVPLPPDADRAKSYFDALAPEYNRAFGLTGRNPFSAFINRFFRGPTFAERMKRIEALFSRIGIKGARVLDLGCGSGQVSLLAASMGATVHGIDIAPRMLAIARETAQRSGLTGPTTFDEGDITAQTLEEADIVLLVGVVEYYKDFEPLVRRAARATRRHLIIGHTTRVLYRMFLRRILFAVSGGSVYFHPMADVIAAATRDGLVLAEEERHHGYSILNFERRA